MRRAVNKAMVAVSFLLAACGSDASPPQISGVAVTIDPNALIANIQASLQQSVASELAGWKFLDGFKR